MKAANKSFTPGLLFLVMGAVFFVMQISFGMRFLTRLWPDDLATRVLTLTVFDVGALGWFIVWLKLAHGAEQRGIATVMFILDLVGASAVALSEVFSAASAWMNGDLIITLRIGATWILGIWVVLNLAAAYAFKYFSPATQLEIRISNEKDNVINTAVDMAVLQIQKETPALAREIQAEIMADARHDLQTSARRALGHDEYGSAESAPGTAALPTSAGAVPGNLPTTPVVFTPQTTIPGTLNGNGHEESFPTQR